MFEYVYKGRDCIVVLFIGFGKSDFLFYFLFVLIKISDSGCFDISFNGGLVFVFE